MSDPRLLHPITHGPHATPSTPTVPGRVSARPVEPSVIQVPAVPSMPPSMIVPDRTSGVVSARSRRAPEVVPGGYSLDELPAPLRRLFARLDATTLEDGAVPLEVLRAELDSLDSGMQMFAPFWMFDACSYRRNLIRRTAAYEALLLCWLPGQRSPIHDHRGSGCAFRVIEGVVTETLYEHTKGSDCVCAASMRWLPPGTICASREFDIHEVANTQPAADLVTLHLYSPPLRDVNLYQAVDSTPAS